MTDPQHNPNAWQTDDTEDWIHGPHAPSNNPDFVRPEDVDFGDDGLGDRLRDIGADYPNTALVVFSRDELDRRAPRALTDAEWEQAKARVADEAYHTVIDSDLLERIVAEVIGGAPA